VGIDHVVADLELDEFDGLTRLITLELVSFVDQVLFDDLGFRNGCPPLGYVREERRAGRVAQVCR
jgi:hypothetical protein